MTADLGEDALRMAEDDSPEACPQGCGSITEDSYGGPCRSCWDLVL